jgi:hypothetical protein
MKRPPSLIPNALKSRSFLKVSLSAVAAGALLVAVAPSIRAQTLVLSLTNPGTNYNATTGVWTATVGSNADAGTTGIATPTLATGATPNGSSAVAFNGTQELTLDTTVAAATSYTVLTYLMPVLPAGQYGTFVDGGVGSFQYRIASSGAQDTVQDNQADLGSGTSTSLNNHWDSINVIAGTSGGSYRLNGAADGTTTAGTFSAGITTIGSQQRTDTGERFYGDIADVEIYSGALTTAQIQGVEATFAAEYATALPAPEPSTWFMCALGLGLLFVIRRLRVGCA